MSARLGFIGGVLALSALDAIVSSRQASGRVSGALSGVGTVIAHLADPEVPAIPDLRGGAAAPTSSSTQPQPGAATAATRNDHHRLPVHHLTTA